MSLGIRLPAGTRVVAVAPSLADADLDSLSEDEQLLARSLQVIPPAGTDPAELAATLGALEGIEAVEAPPRIGLP